MDTQSTLDLTPSELHKAIIKEILILGSKAPEIGEDGQDQRAKEALSLIFRAIVELQNHFRENRHDLGNEDLERLPKSYLDKKVSECLVQKAQRINRAGKKIQLSYLLAQEGISPSQLLKEGCPEMGEPQK